VKVVYILTSKLKKTTFKEGKPTKAKMVNTNHKKGKGKGHPRTGHEVPE